MRRFGAFRQHGNTLRSRCGLPNDNDDVDGDDVTRMRMLLLMMMIHISLTEICVFDGAADAIAVQSTVQL